MGLVRRLRREAERHDIPFSQISILGAIDRFRGAANPSLLAASEGLRSSNLAALLKRLDDDGLVLRERDVSDKRKTLVSLTDRGRTKLQEHRSRRDLWLNDMIRMHLSEREQEVLFKAGTLMERLALTTEQSVPDTGNPK
ncbi:MarR family transcriptional regulator [Pandoraea sputorum]|uniref:MarR family transcriptional regulator n=2 Tax=Pandoraea sputorum TaxID=93222 RepID=A0A5E5AQL2_9BURK|nr:MarR family transcriptional regulator [Pandoraea sputorum]